MMLGISETYLVAYGVALGATNAQIAVLATVPMLIATSLQVYSARMAASIGSRMQLISRVVLLHTLTWIPIILVPYVVPIAYAPWALFAAAVVYMSFGQFAVPAWQSVMSDYIPVKKLGRYFGWRNRLQGILTVGVSIGAGLILAAFGKRNLAGFTAIFVFAMLCRFNAWLCLRRMDEPFRHGSHDVYFSFGAFLRELRETPVGRFVLFVTLMMFAVNLSAPFLQPFILRDMGFGYAPFMAVVTSASIAGFLFQGWWGAYGDLTGNVRMLKAAGWGIAVVPLLWIVSRDLTWLLGVQFIAGCFWGGFTLLTVNFMLETVPPERRIRALAYFNAMSAAAVVLGSATGAMLLHRLPPLFGHSFLALILLSCFCRVVVMMTAARAVRQTRGVA